ncbi:MAG: GNAT family N-acetyltransferase [Anaerolineales bacterium]|nr:GNAT family N-acetyltransferase [Anaerolineales bacterium]
MSAGAVAADAVRAGEEFIIRLLVERDLPALEWDGVFTHFRRLFRQAYDDMRNGSRLLLVMECRTTRELVGQVFIQWNSSDSRYADGRHRGYLYALRIKPDFRGRGLGSRLIRSAEDELRRRGMDAASIGVEKENLRARTLYERHGYRVIAEDPGHWFYNDHEGVLREVVEPAWLMEKRFA